MRFNPRGTSTHVAIRKQLEQAALPEIRSWMRKNTRRINSEIREALGKKVNAYASTSRTYDVQGGSGRGFSYEYLEEQDAQSRATAFVHIDTTFRRPNLFDLLNKAGIPLNEIALSGTFDLDNPGTFTLRDLNWIEAVGQAAGAKVPDMERAFAEHGGTWRVEAGLERKARKRQFTAARYLNKYDIISGFAGAVQYRLIPGERAFRLRFPSAPARYLGVAGKPVDYTVVNGERHIVQIPAGKKLANAIKAAEALKKTSPFTSRVLAHFLRRVWPTTFQRALSGVVGQATVPGEGSWEITVLGDLRIEVERPYAPTFEAAARTDQGVLAGIEAVDPDNPTGGISQPDDRGRVRARFDPIYWPGLRNIWITRQTVPHTLIQQVDRALQGSPVEDESGRHRWRDDECDPVASMSSAKDLSDILTPDGQKAYQEAERAARLRMDANRRPFDYQLVGMAFARLRGFRALIADDMGVGKTMQAIGIMAMLPQARPVVVVCPKNVQNNWQREIAMALPEFRKDNLTLRDCERTARCSKNVVVLKGGADVAKVKPGEPNVYIVTWSSLHTYVEPFMRAGVKLLIGDEADAAKTAPGYQKGRTAASLIKLADTTRYVILLTGTPAPNGRPEELWPLLRALSRGTWGTLRSFENRYMKTSPFDALNNDLQCFMIRRTKNQVLGHLLPEKERIFLPVRLTPQGQAHYDSVQSNFANHLRKKQQDLLTAEYNQMGVDPLDASEEIKRRVNIRVEKALRAEKLQLTNELARVVGRLKVPAAVDAIQDFVNQKRPLVVFLDNKDVREAIKDALDRRGIRYAEVSGEQTTAEAKQKQVNLFNDGKVPVLIATRAGRAGMNLQERSADMLFVQRWWVPGWEMQAEDRIYRYGQTKPVRIHFLEAQGTVDHVINETQDVKRQRIQEMLEKPGLEGVLGGFVDVDDEKIAEGDVVETDTLQYVAEAIFGTDRGPDGRRTNPRGPRRIVERRRRRNPARRRKTASPDATRVQSVLFDASLWGPRQAEAWARNHRYTPIKVERTARYVRVRVQEPSEMRKGSFRTITMSDTDGIKAVIGVPLTRAEKKKPRRANSQRRVARRGAQSRARAGKRGRR